MNIASKFNLKKFRKANRLSQLALAEILGVTQSFISKVESGDAPLPDSMLAAIYDKQDWDVPADVIAIAEMKEEEDSLEQSAENNGSTDIAVLQERVRLLEILLKEKERTIQILMGDK